MPAFHSTTSARLLALASLLSLVGCGATPASRTVSNSDVTTQTAAGGQSQTTVRTTTEQGANGAQNTERTETTRTTTPAPARP